MSRRSQTQTDPLLDQPSAPLFVPKPSGDSKATQIQDGDLFDFDLEVGAFGGTAQIPCDTRRAAEPILDVLVGKTLDRALMEVLEEEELKASPCAAPSPAVPSVVADASPRWWRATSAIGNGSATWSAWRSSASPPPR
jgi:hypothetical protein